MLFVTNASTASVPGPVRVTDVRFSTLIDEATCDALAYTAVEMDGTALVPVAVPVSEPCPSMVRYMITRRNAPFYGPLAFHAMNPAQIQDIVFTVPLLHENAITNIATLQQINAAEDLTVTFSHPVDPVYSKLYLFEATLGQQETLIIRFTEADDRIVIPREQLARLRSTSSGLSFNIKLQETRIEQGVIPIRDLEGNLLSLIDLWNANAHTIEVLLQ